MKFIRHLTIKNGVTSSRVHLQGKLNTSPPTEYVSVCLYLKLNDIKRKKHKTDATPSLHYSYQGMVYGVSDCDVSSLMASFPAT